MLWLKAIESSNCRDNYISVVKWVAFSECCVWNWLWSCKLYLSSYFRLYSKASKVHHHVERRWWIHEQHRQLSKVMLIYLCSPDKIFVSVSGGSGGESKGKRKQNVVPVQIGEILTAPEEGFTVEGSEVGMVVLAGKVISCEKATTKTSYRVSTFISRN